MSDKTFGVKVSEELYERVKMMIENSGSSSKEWFEKAVAVVAVQDLKEGVGNYKQDLSELEVHTTRIYELIANMIQRAEYMKMDAVKESEDKLESRELTITELQGNVKKLTEELKRLEEGSKQTESDKKELSEQLESFRSANDNNQALIQEYKEKIDTLSSLVNEYKGYATENTELKTRHLEEKEQLKAEFGEKEGRMVLSIEELKVTARDQAAIIEQMQDKLERVIEEHNKEMENLKVNFNNQLTQITDKKELEKERILIDVERNYQAKLQEVHESYNEKLSRLYEKFEMKESDGKPKRQK
jgi:chromosome segregation ATPase